MTTCILVRDYKCPRCGSKAFIHKKKLVCRCGESDIDLTPETLKIFHLEIIR